MNELWTKILDFLPEVKKFIETDFSINLVGIIGGLFGFIRYTGLIPRRLRRKSGIMQGYGRTYL